MHVDVEAVDVEPVRVRVKRVGAADLGRLGVHRRHEGLDRGALSVEIDL